MRGIARGSRRTPLRGLTGALRVGGAARMICKYEVGSYNRGISIERGA